MTTTHHGRDRIDDYDWLREKDDPAVLAYLEAENTWTEQQTAHLSELRQTIFDEMKAATQETDLSVPTRRRGHWFYSRSFEGKEYGASCRAPIADLDDWTPPNPLDCAADQPALPGEEVLLDLNELADGHDFFSLGGSSLSLDDALLAYATDTTGDERYTVRVKDLATGELLDDVLTDVLGGVTWSPDNQDFYYSTVDETWRPDKIWRHRLGTAQGDDELVFTEPDARFFVGVGRSRSDRFLYIVAGSKTTTEYRFLDAEDPQAGWQLFAARNEGLEHSIEHAVLGGEDVFLVLHNATGADFEVAVAPLRPTAPAGWAPLIGHDPHIRIEDVEAFATHLVVQQRSQGSTQLRILELDEAGICDDYLIEFDDEVYTVGAGGNPCWDSPFVRLGYTTMAHPPSIYDYDVAARTQLLRRQTPVLGDFDPANYEEHRLWATASDGEQIPISLVARRDRPAGPVPVLLYGYGSYEMSIDPYFSIARLSLLDRGAAFAIAHVRGGGEMGRRWYDGGKLDQKQHTFTDFVACARHLVKSGWSVPELIVGEGGSAGGLLIGAVANLAPEAFGGFVAQVPFVDPLTSMLDASLPLTVTEYDEWGNPEVDPAVYDYLAGYAPYDNVAAVDYPPILAETSLHDTRVLYVEAAKWIARLRSTATGRRDFCLKTEMSAGHGGVSGRYQSWHDRAFSLAWILDKLKLATTE